ncbi:MAG: hypothetical protein V1778_02155 [bacterium]
MDIWLFGNPDLPEDALPLRLLPRLQKEFPEHLFSPVDPLDEWKMPEDLIIIDTVRGIEKVTIFTSLDEFRQAPHVTLHDFDLGMQLAFLKKLGKLSRISIIGIPSGLAEDTVLLEIASALRKLIAENTDCC